MRDHRFSDDAFPLIVAHRGASATHPENTLPAFEEAIRLGALAVELDVRLSRDGVAVVMHDPSVERTTGAAGAVHELTAAQLGAMDAGADAVPAAVPTLVEVLDLASGRAAVALEIKNLPGEPAFEPVGEAIVRAVHADLDRTGFLGPVLVVSFNPASLAASKGIAPEVPTGFLTTRLVPPRDALAHAVRAGHDMVLPGSRELAPEGDAYVARAHASGLRVGTWTVDDPAELRMFLGRGVDAVASNDPETALRVLRGG